MFEVASKCVYALVSDARFVMRGVYIPHSFHCFPFLHAIFLTGLFRALLSANGSLYPFRGPVVAYVRVYVRACLCAWAREQASEPACYARACACACESHLRNTRC